MGSRGPAARRTRRPALQKNPEIEATPESEIENEEPTFAEAKGSEANQHAKKLAQAKSKKKEVPSHTFFTSNGPKVMKVNVKLGSTQQIYVGNLTNKKHKDQLKALVEGWKKDGIWAHDNELKAKIEESRKLLANK